MTLSMFDSTRISLMLAEQVPTRPSWFFTDSLVELKPDKAVTLSTTTIHNEVRLLSLLLKNGSNQQPMPSFCYVKWPSMCLLRRLLWDFRAICSTRFQRGPDRLLSIRKDLAMENKQTTLTMLTVSVGYVQVLKINPQSQS